MMPNLQPESSSLRAAGKDVSMTQFVSVAPRFAVADMSATMHWYKSALGFSGDAVPETEPFVFAIV
jgi:hypothetical protein